MFTNRIGKRVYRCPLLALIGLGVVWAQGAQAVPQIQTWETPTGAEVLFVATDELPMVDIQVVFDAGSARDGSKPGLASQTSAMLTEGAGGLDADAIAERVEAVGAKLSTGTDRDTSSASLRSLSDADALEIAVDTLIRVLSAPTFDPGEFERVRQNQLTALRLAEQDPGDVGRKALYRAIFGDHPYATDPSGTPEAVAALTTDDLRAFHGRFYGAGNATIAMVGALDRAQAERIAARISAELPSGGPPAPLPAVSELEQASVQQIEFPSSQTHLYLGQPGMRRGDPDYFALYLGNHILGGSGLVSLLMEEVREKRGLSYSVYSYFLPLARKGPLMMGLQTQNAQADAAQEVLLDTLKRFIEQGPTDQQLEAAVKNITGGFPLRIAGNSKIVSYLAVIGFYDLPLDYLEVFPDRIRALTTEQIRDAFQRRVDPSRLARVAVGAAVESVENSAAVAPQPVSPTATGDVEQNLSATQDLSATPAPAQGAESSAGTSTSPTPNATPSDKSGAAGGQG
ncbi:peptidase M16 [Lamprobacter modestohalophilus]|uniref:Peptidase M16 n=1 Tax=Lamprobacter modestohalophilus TaxID=1064514 RepID=A0A9X1B5J6_9GAMM|nr:pitrilysin family protein [Lamprobacter modestohalophilus]MBK1620580.1 peptidase M16 [Lamprobacter modestohalophilus]